MSNSDSVQINSSYIQLKPLYIQLIRSDETQWLLETYPNAFLLLTHIAYTARRYSGHPDGLEVGECHLKGCEKYKLSSREYRTAKQILQERGHIEIVVTNRKRQPVSDKKLFKRENETTSETTKNTKSTIVKLLSSIVYDLNYNIDDNLKDNQTTTYRQPDDNKLIKYKNISSYEDNNNNIAQSAARLPKDNLNFNFESWKFEGISEDDLKTWKSVYPHVNLEIEITKAALWIRENPSKSGKKLWRKFLNGWLSRSNDKEENKKAFQTIGKTNQFDKRPKDLSGKPIENPYRDIFNA